MDGIKNIDWHSLALNSVFQKLNSSEKGLSSSESKKRLASIGLNILQTKNSETIPRIILRQLHNPIIYMLLIASAISFLLNRNTDGTVIFCVVVINAIIGFFQEYKANRIIKALSEMSPHETTVIRDGNKKTIPASHVVPGDIIVLQAGDRVPADIRLFFIKNLQCDESILTGESSPVSKHIESTVIETPVADRKCMAFSGTYVTAGTGQGIVIATGLDTEFGKISEMIEHVTPLETPLTLSFKKITNLITCEIAFLGTALFIIASLRGTLLFDAGFSAITLAVAGIPEGLPAIITIASAIGVRRMARRRAIIRQLPAVEALGSTTVICTDKTGTLTYNQMTTQCLWTKSGYSYVSGIGFSFDGQILPEQTHLKDLIIKEEILPLLRAGILCSDATFTHASNEWNPVGDPTEVALVVAGRKLNLNEESLRFQWPREDVIPFDSEKKFMATLNRSPTGMQSILIKGAPEELFCMCSLNQEQKLNLLNLVNEMAKKGMRVLAVAEKSCIQPLQFLEEQQLHSGFNLLGLIGMTDPPRKEALPAIRTCLQAGITVKMITGDHPITAQAIGKDLGILKENDRVITGAELNKIKQEEWINISTQYNVFARVNPEHKLKIVEALQAQEHVVAMTGDGVNDAPALKRADIGVAMGIRGTPVAKEASDIILADDNFASIEAAVEEGRRVYDNLIKALIFILPTSLGQALIVLFAGLWFPIHAGNLLHPILPVQILWINLVVAVALSLPLAFEIQESDIMSRPPRQKNAPVLSGFILIRTLTVSVLMAIGTMGLFLWEYQLEIGKGTSEKVAISEAQTMAVTAIILFQIFYLLHCRSLKKSVFEINFFSNRSILIGVGIVLLAQVTFIYAPFMNRLFHSSSLNLEAWFISIGSAWILFLLIGLEKTIYRYLSKN